MKWINFMRDGMTVVITFSISIDVISSTIKTMDF